MGDGGMEDGGMEDGGTLILMLRCSNGLLEPLTVGHVVD
jgi:hypothetical protein